MGERIEVLCHPGAKETGESHAGLGAFGTPCPPTDFASNHQGTNAAFSQIVVGWTRQRQRVQAKSAQHAHIKYVEEWRSPRRDGRPQATAARRHAGAPRESVVADVVRGVGQDPAQPRRRLRHRWL